MSDDDILNKGGTEDDINSFAHDNGACGAILGVTCDYCGKTDMPTNKPNIEVKQYRDEKGRYDYSDMDLMCKCGHKLGEHLAKSPRACGLNGTGLNDCPCPNFKPVTTPNIEVPNHTDKIEKVCFECGVSANVLTCLLKYGNRPNQVAFECSTYHRAVCDVCGSTKPVTEPRDFFYPDFSLLKRNSIKIKRGHNV